MMKRVCLSIMERGKHKFIKYAIRPTLRASAVERMSRRTSRRTYQKHNGCQKCHDASRVLQAFDRFSAEFARGRKGNTH